MATFTAPMSMDFGPSRFWLSSLTTLGCGDFPVDS
jgi:hypothetical protein